MRTLHALLIVLLYTSLLCRSNKDSSLCNTPNVQRPEKQWSNYTTLIIHHLMIQPTSGRYCSYKQFNLVEFTYRITTCSTSIWLKYIKVELKPNTTWTSPLKTMSFTSQQPTSQRWLISVHDSFMINVTIFKSYVPFTDLCSPHNVGVYEGHEDMNDTLIEKFCGLMSMENVYTKYNKALLQIQASTNMLLFPMSLYARYEVLDQGAAHRFTGKYISCLPRYWLTSVKPSLVLQLASQQFYYWYISSINIFKFDRWWHDIGDLDMIFTYTALQINSCTSTMNTVSIAVYPGLLSHYWIQWRVKPHATLHCNLTEAAQINMDFHVYFTIKVEKLMLDQVSLNMTFYHKLLSHPKRIVAPEIALEYTSDFLFSQNTLRDNSTPHNALQHLDLFPDHGEKRLKFTEFHYHGEATTVPAVMVRTEESDINWTDMVGDPENIIYKEKIRTSSGKSLATASHEVNVLRFTSFTSEHLVSW